MTKIKITKIKTKVPKMVVTYVDHYDEKEGEGYTIVSVLELKKPTKKSATFKIIDYKIIKHTDKLKSAIIVKTTKEMRKFKEKYNLDKNEK